MLIKSESSLDSYLIPQKPVWKGVLISRDKIALEILQQKIEHFQRLQIPLRQINQIFLIFFLENFKLKNGPIFGQKTLA